MFNRIRDRGIKEFSIVDFGVDGVQINFIIGQIMFFNFYIRQFFLVCDF